MSVFTLNLNHDGITIEPSNVFHIDDINNDALIKEALDFEDNKLDSNPLASKYEDSELPDSESLDHLIYKIDCIVKVNISPFLKLDGHWAHILHPQQSTMYHSHTGEREGISFVYYVKAPEDSGNLVFNFDVAGKNLCASIEPEVGKLVLFPTWIPHYTSRNVSEDTRISISGNYYSIQ